MLLAKTRARAVTLQSRSRLFKRTKRKKAEKPGPAAEGFSKELPNTVIVDGLNLIFKAFFALPRLTVGQNICTNAAYGYIRQILLLMREKPDYLIVCNDSPGKTYRHEIFPEYKKTRPSLNHMRADLKPQFEIIKEGNEAFNINSINIPGYEADDLIATYTALARARGHNVIIATNDKDMMQLVRPNVTMYNPFPTTKTPRWIREPDVTERWGVRPEVIPHIQAITGDPIDNIPKVPGIGPKTAANLLSEYGSIETLLENIEEIPEKHRLRLKESRSTMELALKLTTLQTKIDVPPIEDFVHNAPVQDTVMPFIVKWEMETVRKMLIKHFDFKDTLLDKETGGTISIAENRKKRMEDAGYHEGTPKKVNWKVVNNGWQKKGIKEPQRKEQYKDPLNYQHRMQCRTLRPDRTEQREMLDIDVL